MKVHALIVCEKCADVHTRCGQGNDGTFCFRPRKGRKRVPLTCGNCIKLDKLDQKKERSRK